MAIAYMAPQELKYIENNILSWPYARRGLFNFGRLFQG